MTDTTPPADDSPFVRTLDDKALKLAQQFHALYEMMSHAFNYETREETRAFDPTSNNGRLMQAVCRSLLFSESIEFPKQPMLKENTPFQDYIMLDAVLHEIRKLDDGPTEEHVERLMADLRDNVLTPEQNGWLAKHRHPERFNR